MSESTTENNVVDLRQDVARSDLWFYPGEELAAIV